jgi:cytochrome c oxidase subunit II
LHPLLAIYAGLFFPDKGVSPNAQDIFELYVLIFVMALVVFIGVQGSLIWFLLKFKARRGRVAAQIHGNTRLEIGWTVGAAVVLVFITVVTFIKLPGIKNPAASDIDAQGNPVAANAFFAATDQKQPPKGAKLNIVVDGQQYVWRFQYPPQDGKVVYAYEEMVVPVGMTVTLDITSDDVAHSWWIPALGGKADAVPGYTNKSWFKVTKPGTYFGQCAELCGRNHANMYARVKAVPFTQYQAWYDSQAAAIKAARDAGAKQRAELNKQQQQPTQQSQTP